MNFNNRRVRSAKKSRFDHAGRLNTAELLAVLFDELDVPYDTSVLADRDRIKTADLRAILTALWLQQDRDELHEDAIEEMEFIIERSAPTGEH